MTHYTLCGVSFHAEIPGPPRHRHYPTPVVEVSAGSKALGSAAVYTVGVRAHNLLYENFNAFFYGTRCVKPRRAAVPIGGVLDVFVNLEAEKTDDNVKIKKKNFDTTLNTISLRDTGQMPTLNSGVVYLFFLTN